MSPTPRISVGIHRTADSVSAPRAFHPRQDLCFSAAPIACDGFALRTLITLGRGWTGVSLSPLPVIAIPGAIGTYSLLFSLRTGQNRPRTVQSIRWCSLLSFRQITAQQPPWLMLITKATGNILMNGYSVFKHPGEHNRKTSHSICR